MSKGLTMAVEECEIYSLVQVERRKRGYGLRVNE